MELREVYFDEEALRAYAEAATVDMPNARRALPYMLKAHAGQQRKSKRGAKIPYATHPLTLACHALSLGVQKDRVIAAALLHDVVEDCGVPACALPVDDDVRDLVMRLTKTERAPRGTPKARNPYLDRYYARISADPDAVLVKLLDRCNNLSCMASAFTRERMLEYIEETEHYALPLLEALPVYRDAAFLLKYQILSVTESLKQVLI